MNIITYKTFLKRLIGLSFRKKKLDFIAYFPKCNSIHTFFMKQPIDVIMTDKDGTIIYQKEGVKPWRIILPKKGAVNTYELPNRSIQTQIFSTKFSAKKDS